jgi:LAGLIDADG-like domain
MDFSAEYLAGLFDGEGCIHMGKRPRNKRIPGYFISVSIVMTHPEIVYAIAEQFGAYVTVNKKDLKYKSRRRAYQLVFNGTPAKKFLLIIYDYLRIKKEEARIAIAFQTNMENYRGRIMWMSQNEIQALTAYRERLRLRLKECKNLLIYGAADWDVGEFGEYPMPDLETDAEGQYRAKQKSEDSSGVCNEHVPTPKGKICSALDGNIERAAEMPAPDRRGQRLRLVE